MRNIKILFLGATAVFLFSPVFVCPEATKPRWGRAHVVFEFYVAGAEWYEARGAVSYIEEELKKHRPYQVVRALGVVGVWAKPLMKKAKQKLLRAKKSEEKRTKSKYVELDKSYHISGSSAEYYVDKRLRPSRLYQPSTELGRNKSARSVLLIRKRYEDKNSDSYKDMTAKLEKIDKKIKSLEIQKKRGIDFLRSILK